MLHQRAGSSHTVFANGQLKRDCTSDGQIHPERLNADGDGKSFDDFCNDPRVRNARLSAPQVLALPL